MPPLVSIITSVYNGEAYLKECVDSILNQTLQNFEFIVLNNGSTDHSLEILQQYTDPRLKVINQENLGLSRSLNKGIQLSQSDLIARLDADDYSFPTRLELQTDFMSHNPDYVLCGSRFRELIGNDFYQQKVPFLESDETIRKSFCYFNPFSHSSVMFRKQAFLETGGYNHRFEHSQDYDLWFRMLKLGKACILKEELTVVRLSLQSASYQNSRRQKLEGLRIRWKAFHQFGGAPLTALYYFLKSVAGLTYPSKSNLRR
jgi:glycosyltransferase involved in cell wall biosynthesis